MMKERKKLIKENRTKSTVGGVGVRSPDGSSTVIEMKAKIVGTYTS